MGRKSGQERALKPVSGYLSKVTVGSNGDTTPPQKQKKVTTLKREVGAFIH